MKIEARVLNEGIIGIGAIVATLVASFLLAREIALVITDFKKERKDGSRYTLSVHTPESLQRIHRYTRLIPHTYFLLAILLLMIIVVKGILGPGISYLTIIPLVLVVVISTFLHSWFFRRERFVICPHCKHKMPINTEWKCPYKNCSGEEFIPDTFLNRILEERVALLGQACKSCGQEPAGFFCVACGEPMYFTNEKTLQKPELCARPVMPEGQVTEPAQEVATEAQQKGKLGRIVSNIMQNSNDIVSAERDLDKHLAEMKETLSPEDYGRYSRAARRVFDKEKREAITGKRW